MAGCSGRPSSAGSKGVEVKTEVLSDVSAGMKVVEVNLSSAEGYRVTVEDAQGGDRDSAQISRSASISAAKAGATPVVGRVLIVADLVTLEESDHDVLSWLVQISGGGVTVGGPSQVPVPKGSKLTDLVEILATDGVMARGQSQDLVRVKDRVFLMTVE
jgi:hypothetical protein